MQTFTQAKVDIHADWFSSSLLFVGSQNKNNSKSDINKLFFNTNFEHIKIPMSENFYYKKNRS